MDSADIQWFRIDSSGLQARSGSTDASFPWWSFGKTVIAACALNLAERGALALDEPAGDGPWTLRQLLAHAAGLPDYGRMADYHRAVAAGEQAWPRDRLMETALAGGVLFEAGAGWAYSNIGYMLAVEQIERAAEQPFGDVVTRLITEPLGLRSARLARSPAEFADLCPVAPAGYDPNWVYHGCLVGTAADAARLLQALVDGRLLDRRSLQAMQTARSLGGAVSGRPWTAHGYGLGLMCGAMAGAGRASGHTGGGPGSVCTVYHFPDLDDAPCVAAFAPGGTEGAAEAAASALAMRATGAPA